MNLDLDQETASAPGKLLSWTEVPRALLELSTFAAVSPYMAGAPKGDGHDVLFLPGFLWSDATTEVMRHFIGQLGYRAHGWGLGTNLGPRTIGDDGRRLRELVEEIVRAGSGRLSLVGHSLGGIMARDFARENPDLVRQVICVGSPFVGDPGGVNTTVARLHDWLTGAVSAPEKLARTESPTVPISAIYSDLDGLVASNVCTEVPAERAENIGVYGSHLGMMVNPAVYYALADRLSQPEGAWTAFSPTGWRRSFYTGLAVAA